MRTAIAPLTLSALVVFGGVAWAGGQASSALATRIPPSTVPTLGMSSEALLSQLGQPEHSDDIGAACGMLEVMTWARIRVVVVDGVVTSIAERTGLAPNDVRRPKP
ncbi:MAG: hypothetical protein AAF493_28965 [Pseudomonadota bacterium]